MAYYRIAPWGDERADYRAGTIAATVVNVNRRKNSKPANPKDFMPRFGEEHKPPVALERQSVAADVRSVFSQLKVNGDG